MAGLSYIARTRCGNIPGSDKTGWTLEEIDYNHIAKMGECSLMEGQPDAVGGSGGMAKARCGNVPGSEISLGGPYNGAGMGKCG
jgi:hypothetical protein